ncbi:L,D-transpeptidase [Pseudonocardia sp. WMMC193]|uniref:L,D-transpeptidase n=1 Tax=Pseudonocardia sp. WMMC193 TaxID=2911965 RepID=UPI001F3E038D|nr:L,D-transpeptidase [Pseudonocardia sp. WMMC193]MCF7548755.1 L,D-transpeptidase [Pseudonocardia sp. WMMC193]
MANHILPPRTRRAARRPSRTGLVGWAVIGVVAVLALVLGVGMLVGGAPSPAADGGAAPVAAAAPGAAAPVAVDPATLPESTTYTALPGAAPDPAPDRATDGRVAHPVRETVVHDAPNGTPIARMPVTQIGDTWLPVVEQQGDWVRVLLPSRPESSTGWLSTADLDIKTTPYRIEVHLGSRTLALFRDGVQQAQWTVGIGKESAPTPTGRTFLLGAFTDAKQKFSPVILPLGTHSPTHDTFGGGPGTVAIHTWPTADVFGQASSDGCIRVPADALRQLSTVPLGTLVMIDNS